MRFDIKKKLFTQALRQLEGALPPKRWRLDKIYYCVLMQVNCEGVTLTVTNGDVRLELRQVESVHVIEVGSYAVSYDGLIEALKAFPRNAELVFCLQDGGLSVTDDTCSHEDVVEGYASGAFPAPVEVRGVGTAYEEEAWDGSFGRDYYLQKSMCNYTYQVLQNHTQLLVLPRDQFLAMVEKVAFVAAKDDSRPLYMGIYTQVREGVLSLAATDGFVLAQHWAHVTGAGTWEFGVPIWARYLLLGLQLIPEGTPQVTLECFAMTKQQVRRNGYEVKGIEPVVECVLVRLRTEHLVVDIRPLIGVFPDYHRVIPQQITTQATCETDTLLLAVEELSPIAKEANNAITFAVKEDRIEIEVKRKEQPAPVTRKIGASTTGDELRIILDYNYVLAILRATPTPRISLGLNEPLKPAVFRPDQDGGTTYVVYPMIEQ